MKTRRVDIGYHRGNIGPLGLTHTQVKVLEYIGDHMARRVVAPTIREIADHMGWRTTNSVVCHLNPLVRKGALVMKGGRARSYLPAGLADKLAPLVRDHVKGLIHGEAK